MHLHDIWNIEDNAWYWMSKLWWHYQEMWDRIQWDRKEEEAKRFMIWITHNLWISNKQIQCKH